MLLKIQLLGCPPRSAQVTGHHGSIIFVFVLLCLVFFVIHISIMPEGIDVTVVIPAKDEELRLPPFLQGLITCCRQSRLRYEIIVVDDGSTDKTAENVLALKKTFEGLSLLSLGRNHGKGHAVKQGLLSAHGDVALFMDADGSTPSSEIERNLGFFQEGYDMVIGSRLLPGAGCRVEASLLRRHLGSLFNFLVSHLLIKGIKDTQCGFKMFRYGIIRPLWEKVQIQGFGFDLEVLFLAQKMGYKILEVPVNWKHVDHSKIHLIKDSFKMLTNIFQIKHLHKTAS
jgi:dolichyl-phosphate beta-glucosyltransferase